MKKYIFLIGLLAVTMCFAAPSLRINAGSVRTSDESYVTVNGGSVENAASGTPFFAVHTKPCATTTIFKGPEGNPDALTIIPAGDMGNVTVSVYSGSFHPNTSSSVVQWWNVNTTTLQSSSITFRYRNAYLGSLILTDLAVYEYNGGWVKLSETITGSSVGPYFTEITFSGINFSNSKGSHPLILADKDDNTLPVELSFFTAGLDAFNYVLLQWITQSETNVSGFRIYRGSTDALQTATQLNEFITASNTSQAQSYVFTDNELSEPGVYYYWLESVDLDGGTNIYGPVRVDFDMPEGGTPGIIIVPGINNIYPNPFNPETSIRFGIEKDAFTKLVIYNTRGQIVRTLQAQNLTRGNHLITWNGLDDRGQSCSTGVYVLRLTTGKASYSLKLTLLK